MKKPKMYIGIDPSLTGTGIVIIGPDGEIVESCTIKTKLRGTYRLIFIKEEIRRIIKIKGIEIMVGLEGYSYQSFNNATYPMGELGGVIRVLLIEGFHQTQIIQPSQLKKFATGKGNTKKELVIKEVYKRWGVEFPDNNQCDAYVLARIMYAMDHDDGLIKPQKEVVKDLKKKGYLS